ncbi:hypothetical protein PSN13_02708 [Micromonospora saelicesensis]|uniref:Uncharacterized protein n=1 Tax=Micromonospora saelicesensis TaxID=285676 RepID=A0A328NMC8_9ACTN|nr:hypothetical protein [Micromonospora saelicesensis]RAO34938.1 hypothetical protein PSN13_02708 [Micromonospora saelicesensis]
MTSDRPPGHEHRARVDLPQWMRQPTPTRRSPARYVDDLIEGWPALRTARRAVWHWRGRTRWSESHPNIVAVLSFVVAAVLGAALVTGAYYLLALATSGEN